MDRGGCAARRSPRRWPRPAPACGLQEVWGAGEQNLAAQLAGRLGMSWCWAAAERVNGDGAGDGAEMVIGNAILSRWPIAAHTEVRLPTSGSGEGRVALHARISAPGGELPMFTTHLTCRPGGSQLRTTQVRRLAELAAGRAAGCGCPPVVTGDLNAEPDSGELRLLCGTLTPPAVPGLVLADAWRYADPLHPGHTWDRSNGCQADSMIPDSRIDHILAGLPRRGRGRVRSAWLAGSSPVDGVWPPDHFAVVADLQQ